MEVVCDLKIVDVFFLLGIDVNEEMNWEFREEDMGEDFKVRVIDWGKRKLLWGDGEGEFIGEVEIFEDFLFDIDENESMEWWFE